MPRHTVKEGDDLSSIAALYGFASWKTVYDHPENAELRKKRPSPNLLAPGDVVVVPDKAEKNLPAPSGQNSKFQVALPKVELRVFARDAVGHKLADAKYKLVVDGQTLEGAADGDGLIKARIPPKAMSATLEVALAKPPPPEKPPADGLVLPKETFKLPDEPKDPALTAEPPAAIVWQLKLGALQPVDVVEGQQNRLHNLGYRCAVDGTVGPETTAAAHAFQTDRKIKVGPIDDATRAELVKAHDKGAA